MNNQQAFDKMVVHAFTQKVAAKTGLEDDKTCFYRMPKAIGNLKCFVGALIPDEEYHKDFEGNNAEAIADNVPTLLHVTTNMLSDAQRIHDCRPTSEWFERLDHLADEYKLNKDVLIQYDGVL